MVARPLVAWALRACLAAGLLAGAPSPVVDATAAPTPWVSSPAPTRVPAPAPTARAWNATRAPAAAAYANATFHAAAAATVAPTTALESLTATLAALGVAECPRRHDAQACTHIKRDSGGKARKEVRDADCCSNDGGCASGFKLVDAKVSPGASACFDALAENRTCCVRARGWAGLILLIVLFVFVCPCVCLAPRGKRR